MKAWLTTDELKTKAFEAHRIPAPTITYWLRHRQANGLDEHCIQKRSGRTGRIDRGRILVNWAGFEQWYEDYYS